LPSPIECAKIQPNPVEVLNLDRDSTTLSNRNRTPPICKKKISKLIPYDLTFQKHIHKKGTVIKVLTNVRIQKHKKMATMDK
jgi:hypothetical protein